MPARAVIRALDAGHVRKAAVLSFAYRLAAPGMGLGAAEAAEIGRENAWTAAQVRPFRGRLVGFCSVNPLKPYAIPSITRCKAAGLTGLKLHLANSYFDFAKPAHLAGWSRDDAVSDAALTRFAERCYEQPRLCARLKFNLAAALPLEDDSEANRTRLQANLCRLGLWRFVFAADGPVSYQPASYDETTRRSLPLSAEETAQVLRNVAPYLRGRAGEARARQARAATEHR